MNQGLARKVYFSITMLSMLSTGRSEVEWGSMVPVMMTGVTFLQSVDALGGLLDRVALLVHELDGHRVVPPDFHGDAVGSPCSVFLHVGQKLGRVSNGE